MRSAAHVCESRSNLYKKKKVVFTACWVNTKTPSRYIWMPWILTLNCQRAIYCWLLGLCAAASLPALLSLLISESVFVTAYLFASFFPPCKCACVLCWSKSAWLDAPPLGGLPCVCGALEFASTNTCKENKWMLMCWWFYLFLFFNINKQNEVVTAQFLSLAGGSF